MTKIKSHTRKYLRCSCNDVYNRIFISQVLDIEEEIEIKECERYKRFHSFTAEQFLVRPKAASQFVGS